MKFAVGVNSTSLPLSTTVPPTALPTAVTASVCADSLAGPALSFASRLAVAITRRPESSATADKASSLAAGASLTSVIVNVTAPPSVSGAGAPLVVPLSLSV